MMGELLGKPSRYVSLKSTRHSLDKSLLSNEGQPKFKGDSPASVTLFHLKGETGRKRALRFSLEEVKENSRIVAR